MRRGSVNILALAAMLALGACSGGASSGSGGGGSVGSAGVDMSVVTGAGSYSDPYVIPATLPAGSTAGVDNYLAVDGIWRPSYQGYQTRNYGTDGFLYAGAMYDSTADRWYLQYYDTIYAGNYMAALDYDSSRGLYAFCGPAGCGSEEATLQVFDADPAAAQYGTFAHAHFATNLSSRTVDVHSYVYYGLASRDMPTAGSATYNGVMQGSLVLAGNTYDAAMEIAFDADFGAGSFLMQHVLPGQLTNAAGDLAGSATFYGGGSISGNTISGLGTLGASAEGRSASSGATIGGSFYGPNADEVAGALSGSGTGVSFTGGFWAAK